MNDKPRDHCGIFGIYNHPEAARLTYYGLHALQHRGQESAGIVTATYDEQRRRNIMPIEKDFGLVLDVFANDHLFEDKLLGDSAIGHTRYSTSGSATNPANIQPFLVHYQHGNLALAHNGNLSNARAIRDRLTARGTLFQTTSDSELILHLVAQSAKESLVDRLFDALSQCEGAFSLVLLTDESLIAVRDPHGFRPLALGRIDPSPERPGPAYCVASETCAFDMMRARYVRDIKPGEVLIIDRKGCYTDDFQSFTLPGTGVVSQCIFEYVYFSRPDSMIFGEMVDKVRRKMGKLLAHDAPVPKVGKDDKKPIVFAVPDSSNTATLGYVSESNKMGRPCKYEIGLIRNHYVGRTFISPGQNAREFKVRSKFNPVRGVLQDRTVVMVDDSIVRGTTARQLIQMVRDAGAREVHFRVASPPVIAPCFYGMDFPSHDELLATQFKKRNGEIDIRGMAKWLGVDTLGYLSPEGMLKAMDQAHDGRTRYCSACFTNSYPVPVETSIADKEENDF